MLIFLFIIKLIMEKTKQDYFKFFTIVGGSILVIAFFAILKLASSITMPLTLAIFLYFMVKPIITSLERKGAYNWIAITVAMLALVLLLLIVGWTIFYAINTLTQADNIKWFTERGTQLSKFIQSKIKSLEGKSITEMLGINYSNQVSKMVISISGKLMHIMSQLLLVFIFVLFLLLERQSLSKKMLAVFPNVDTVNKVRMFKTINTSISRYIVVKTIVSAITGVLFFLVCLFTGVKFALLWGILAFVLNYIPTIGSIVATLGVTFIAALQYFDTNITLIIVVFILVLMIQNIIGNYLDPKLSGNELNLSPFIILVSLSLWGFIWGIPGMFLAVPITSAVQIVCANIESLKPIAVFLGTGKTVDNIINDKSTLREKFKRSRKTKST